MLNAHAAHTRRPGSGLACDPGRMASIRRRGGRVDRRRSGLHIRASCRTPSNGLPTGDRIASSRSEDGAFALPISGRARATVVLVGIRQGAEAMCVLLRTTIGGTAASAIASGASRARGQFPIPKCSGSRHSPPRRQGRQGSQERTRRSRPFRAALAPRGVFLRRLLPRSRSWRSWRLGGRCRGTVPPS